MEFRVVSKFATAVLISLFGAHAGAQVTINNGITGDGFWEVVSEDAGDSRTGRIDPVGALGPTDVIFRLETEYSSVTGSGNLSDNTTTPATLTGSGEVTSSGTFLGANGTINWSATAAIAPGSALYTVRFDFDSSSPFGDTRIVNYFDQDVLGSGGDIVVVNGTPGQNDFQLLTVDSGADVGVALAADYNGTANMTWAGWAAMSCCGAPSTFSISGESDLTTFTDPRFPANDAYGPADVTTSFAWDFNPSATTASMTMSIGASPDGAPPPPPISGPSAPPTPVPTLGSLWLLSLSILLGWLGRSRLPRRRAG